MLTPLLTMVFIIAFNLTVQEVNAGNPGDRWPGQVETDYSGAITGNILRDSEDFQNYVKYFTDPNVYFVDGYDDHLMQNSIGGALRNLIDKVEARDPREELAVQDAWDTTRDHAERSLHREGRALDLWTRYGYISLNVLFDLATESGFDWVYHETTHIHVSKQGYHATVPDLECKDNQHSVLPGGSTQYQIKVINTHWSYEGDTISLSASGVPSGWTAQLSTTSVTLGWQQSAMVTLGLTAPSTAREGDRAVIQVTGVSSKSPPTDIITTYTTVGSSAVGGVVVPIDKLGLLTPYVGLASTIMVATVATAIYVKRVKHRKEKQ